MYGRDESYISEIIKEPHPILEENELIIEYYAFIAKADPISYQGYSERSHESIDMKSIEK